MISRWPITVSAPLLVGIPVLIVGIVLSVMWNHQSRDAVTQLADRNIEQIHAMASTKVADVLSIPVRICELNAHLIRSGALDPEQLAAWRPTLARQARAFDMLSAISWGSADGRSAWVSRYADGSFFWALKDNGSDADMAEWRLDDQGNAADTPSGTFAFELNTRPWFQTPRDAGQPTWSPPFVWVGGVGSEGRTLGISYGIPIHDDGGRFLGVIDADYSLNDLSRFLGSMEIGRTGIAVLASADGRLLATSGDAAIVASNGERMTARESSDPLVAAAARFVGDATPEQHAHAEVQVNGAVHYLRASAIGSELGLDWSLMTIIPEQDFLAEIDAELQRSGLASLLAVVLAVSAGFAASRWLVSPLTRLVSAVRQIGAGDLETRVEVHHAPEYNQLADEINLMTEGLQDRMRMRQSLSLAMEVQKNLLPSKPPEIPGLDIAGHSTYCDETGGDYYDYLDVSGADSDLAVIAVGDVMGHGVAAAMLMATARGILRSRAAESGSLADFLDHVNAMLVPDTRGQRFMTMLLITVSPPQDTLRWASAGHGPPLVYSPQTDDFLELDGGGLPLGLMDGEHYDEYVQPNVPSGSVILAATDGLWETMDSEGTAFGMDRVRDLIRSHATRPAAEIRTAILETLTRFRGPANQDDDLTFVIARIL